MKIQELLAEHRRPLIPAKNYITSYHIVYLYHATYFVFLDSIMKHGLKPATKKSRVWSISKPVVCLAIDYDIAVSFAEEAENIPEKWKENIVVLKIPTSSLNMDKLFFDRNVLTDYSTGKPNIISFEYHDIIPASSLEI